MAREPRAGEVAWTLDGTEVVVEQDGVDEDGRVAVLWTGADGASRCGFVAAEALCASPWDWTAS